MGVHGSYMKNVAKNFHVKDDLSFLDNKLVVPATFRGTFSTMLHETHPGQIGMQSLAEYIWWPHIYREIIYHHGKSFSQCLKAGMNLKVLLGTDKTTKLPTLTGANGEINLDFVGSLDAFWGTQQYILLCIDQFTKFPLAKIVYNTSSNTVISFLNDYCHLHGFPRKIRVDHGSCFLSQDFLKIFRKKINIEIIYCTVGNRSLNGLVERQVYRKKPKLLEISFDLPKSSLNSSIEKIIMNLRTTKPAPAGSIPFEKHFNRTANTRWKNLISFDDRLDKGESILSNRRASNWELHDRAEDGYLDEDKDSPSDPEDSLPLAQRFPSAHSTEGRKQSRSLNTTKKVVAGGKLYRRATNRKKWEPYFNLVKKDIIDSSDYTITLDNGHTLRNSDLAIKGKLLPGHTKIVVNQPSIVHKLHVHSSLAGKRKLSPPKMTLSTGTPQLRQGTSGVDRPTQTSSIYRCNI